MGAAGSGVGRHRAAPPGLLSSGGFQGAPITRCRGGERLDGGLGFHKGKIPPGSSGNIFPEQNQGSVGTGRKENK